MFMKVNFDNPAIAVATLADNRTQTALLVWLR